MYPILLMLICFLACNGQKFEEYKILPNKHLSDNIVQLFLKTLNCEYEVSKNEYYNI